MFKQLLPPRGVIPDDNILAQARYLRGLRELTCVLDAMPSMLVILNSDRKIVFANRYLQEVLQIDDVQSVYGLLPGDLMDCTFAVDGGGCGSTEACQGCGGNVAIASCQHGKGGMHECRITQLRTGHALDLRIAGTPLVIDDQTYSLLVMTDISHEKRRKALERVFFHDLMNVATGIIVYARVLSHSPDSSHAQEAADNIRRLVFQLSDEIKAQRELVEAEADELRVFLEPVCSQPMLSNVLSGFRDQPIARDRFLVLDSSTQDVTFGCDRTLLARILGNMVKNALEASNSGERITAACKADSEFVEFTVHNPGFIPRDIQVHIFQRSFSTKGSGRGLGTYSIKLLAERYLKGKAWFTSTTATGTTFHVRFPRQQHDPA